MEFETTTTELYTTTAKETTTSEAYTTTYSPGNDKMPACQVQFQFKKFIYCLSTYLYDI